MADDRMSACCQPDCGGTEVWVRDDYGSLGEGGSQEVYRCDTCSHVCRSQMAD